MAGFTRHRRSRAVIANFAGYEAELLRSLANQLGELLQADRPASVSQDPLEALMDFSGPTSEPEDPVLARLLPSGYRDDEEAAGDFRRFTEGTLRDGKAAAAALVVSTLEEAGLPPVLQVGGQGEPDDPGDLGKIVINVELDEPDAETWLRCLTDIRLALAVRLGVDDDDQDYWLALPDEDPRAQTYDIYQWLGWIQETLVDALTR